MSEWTPTSSIQMAVNSAEMHIIGTRGHTELHLSCSLINISRGSASVIMKRRPIDDIHFSGSIHIPLDRPIMKLDINLPYIVFEQLSSQLNHPAPRPTTLVVLLDETLMVNLSGDLHIDAALDTAISDISWALPII